VSVQSMIESMETNEDREAEVRRAVAAHERALARLKEVVPGKATAGVEAHYGQTYQHLVRLGERPQLRLKYRRA
jgi:hypothetical protein